ncbi:predicted pyrophosphatase [Moorella thermoacetica Y72]|uniref:Predicted pyrophosphatase n=1 Tax=Moorella thermoacetica Y72 TaxID=1325331 RepID=A0A0S6UE11_NEOTH|nr:predicted pyrophosphatase [Moorella thermoacetica Y72]
MFASLLRCYALLWYNKGQSKGEGTLEQKIIALPRLDNLTPTMESTALKLMEEAGELAQAIGKLRGLSGEQVHVDSAAVRTAITRELLDVAQTAVSLMFVLEEQYGVDIQQALEEHIAKLRAKGYIK